MSREAPAYIRVATDDSKPPLKRACVDSALLALGVTPGSGDGLLRQLPFSENDTTAGSESELQAVIVGKSESVDLPISIRESTFFKNLVKSAMRGDMPMRTVDGLMDYLQPGGESAWENSWARFPRHTLSSYAETMLERDLLADKSNPAAGKRLDAGKFAFTHMGEERLRLPVSYLLKIALADFAGTQMDASGIPASMARKLLSHFLNDNTSPETFSFYVSPVFPSTGMGKAVAVETSRRFLLSQLLTAYANKKFLLEENGQRALVFHSPHPPVRQRRLNELIPDSFYRELFMSPCLSGWDRGEEKHAYMGLCHEVLSRSQLNTIAKSRDAGIITRNLVALPNISNTSLANNGTHVSIGSLMLGRALSDPSSGFTAAHEKSVGDLVIKAVEHFLPLFPGVLSCSPYRMDFPDFHPERALGFLPHELHYTHLRMIWRRWKKKARLKVFGFPITPFGPEWLDRLAGAAFNLRGDFIPDFRLVDYLVSLMSTQLNPALDGIEGNDERLKKDLMRMGVFDKRMSLYLLYKLRRHGVMGFSGYEGRHYSLFESITEDMAEAVNLQVLVTAFAYMKIADGSLRHENIPDDPFVESERRQIFFCAALGVPTVYIRETTENGFLMDIVRRVKTARRSNRYHGYIRIHTREYQRALLGILMQEGRGLIEMFGLEETMRGLNEKLEGFDEISSFGKITGGILKEGGFKNPFSATAREWNLAAEKYYRGTLRVRQAEEALDGVNATFADGGRFLREAGAQGREHLASVLGGETVSAYIGRVAKAFSQDTLGIGDIAKLISLVLLEAWFFTQIHRDAIDRENTGKTHDTASVY